MRFKSGWRWNLGSGRRRCSNGCRRSIAVSFRIRHVARLNVAWPNGEVYMVKVTPKGGIPYYYIDTDGDGRLELDPSQQALNPVQPVYWKIKEWD